MGLLTPLSHVPNYLLHFDEQMSFGERFYNAVYSLWDYIIRTYIFLPQHNEIVRKYFKHLESKYFFEILSFSNFTIKTNNFRRRTTAHCGGARKEYFDYIDQ